MNVALVIAVTFLGQAKVEPTHANVRYGPHQRNVLDFYQAKGNGPRPLLVYIHGGGWTGGDKRRNRRSVQPFLNRGISYAAVNYRLTPKNPLPAPVHDAARAIQFIRSKAKEWNLDKTRVALTGGSAGACTSMWILCHDDLADPKSADPVARESTRVTAAAVSAGQTSIDPMVIKKWLGPNVLKHRMINMAMGEKTIEGALKNYAKYKARYIEFSPYNHVTRDDPPLLMTYGSNMRLPSQNAGHGIHHPVYGVKMKEKSDRVGQECHLIIRGVSSSSKYRNANEFLFAKLLGDDKTPVYRRVARLQSQFEQARQKGDLKTSLSLVTADAKTADARNRLPRSVRYDLFLSSRSQKRNKRARLEPTMVLSRNIQVFQATAIVSEIIGAQPGASPKRVIKPRRRSVVWVRDDRGWKISHIHESAYSTWEKAISSYEGQDKEAPPSPGGVVFIGSSSIRGWKSLRRDFAGTNVIGRGFGGSQMVDSIGYAHRVVIPYKPRAVAVYAGDNDIAAGKSAKEVARDFRTFVGTIHAADPKVQIGFIAIKPSLARIRLWARMKVANGLVEDFAASNPRVDYLDIANPMLAADGTPRRDLFVKDGLHLNAKGYRLWADIVRPWLKQR